MGALERLGPAELRRVMSAFRDGLRSHQALINRLNVYPVPDGDTGTNMALTLESVLTELDDAGPGVDDVCRAISHGSLMGARGNSGVILSQVLRGLVGGLQAVGEAGAPELAEALTAASAASYQAVMKPVEGTILTVVRETAEAATAAATAGSTLVELLDAAHAAASSSVDRTPELLPVLAEAGVVDAGGRGFVLFVDALLHVVDGRAMPQPPDDDLVTSMEVHAHTDHVGHDGSDLRYEVMYLLDAPDGTIDAFKEVWAGLGDSIVVVGGEGLWNCHIHTDDIGASVEAALDVGRPRNIRVTDLHEQVEEERWVREAEVERDLLGQRGEHVPTGVVAVATGDGVMRIFHSLGVQGIVPGGQSMNPSTADLVRLVDQLPADEVVILPNNKNIIPVAEQVDGQVTKPVSVVPTTSITEGFASLLEYDPLASAADNANAMRTAIESVVSGEVCQAVRDSASDVGPIAVGDFMGIGPGGVRSVNADLGEACIRLLDVLVGADHEVVTIIEGDGATDAITRHVAVWLGDHRPGVATEVHHGGQPLYPYLFGIE